MKSNSFKPFTITIIGTGFVGVVTSAVLAKLGHTVYGLDIDEVKISSLIQGRVPFYEPDLKELLQDGLKSNRLHFTTQYEVAISRSDIIMIAVGTPSAKDGTADLKYVLASAQSMAPHLNEKAIVVIKSTVPPGTNSLVRQEIAKHTKAQFAVASAPEFLKEGTAVADTLKPDRVVIGATESWVIETLSSLHKPLSTNIIITSPESAQMAKYTANAYLAQRITFINQIANLCEKNGADIDQVIKIIGADKRIGDHYWYPGLGYGGSCFPKDVKELAAYAKSIGEGDNLLITIDQLNDKRMDKKLKKYEKAVGGFAYKTVAVLGLSFKPNTNDLREAPSTKIIPYLKHKKAIIKAYDPEAGEEANKHIGPLFIATDPYEAVAQAQIIFLLIEWPALTKLNLQKLASHAASDCTFIDTRNQYDPAKVQSAGFKYIGTGKTADNRGDLA